MADPVRLAVVGAGLIGQRHAVAVTASTGARLAAIVDPADGAAAFAAAHAVPHYPSLDAMITAGGVDGLILATPNTMHEDGALACIRAGLPVLVEKPIATDLAAARRIIDAADTAGVAVAVGHHRRHNPLITKAKALIDAGELGQIAAVQGTTWFMKPDDYFATSWRRQKGAGPVYLNLIHDIDLLQHLVGRIRCVQAMESSRIRGNEVEDTAVILLRFDNGALGTVNVCDTAVAPWSWELTARENPAYAATGQDCYLIGGTMGSLSLPQLALWHHPDERSWWGPMSTTRYPFDFTDPLILQVDQFAAVIRDNAPPLVTARDGFAALAVIEAIKQAAATGAPIDLEDQE